MNMCFQSEALSECPLEHLVRKVDPGASPITGIRVAPFFLLHPSRQANTRENLSMSHRVMLASNVSARPEYIAIV